MMRTALQRLLLIFAVFGAFLLPADPAAAEADLKITDIVVGTGDEAVQSAEIDVHYTGWLMDGSQFDSSHDRGKPLTFTLGAGRVIPGWDQGVVGMKVGGKRELIVPPELAYGKRGAGKVIPPDSTLKFEVELVAVKPLPYTNINNAQLRNMLTRGVKIVDIRTQPEWRETGVIKGSLLMPAFDEDRRFVKSFPDDFGAQVAPDDEVILVCRTGSRTSVIAKALATQMGYTKIYNVENGITRWIKDGNPVDRPELK